MKKITNKQILCCGVLALMAVAFFLISRCGFLWSDDYAMGYGKVFTLQQVLSSTKWFYLNWGGGFLGAACQYLFCGLLGNDKIWFDIVNTMVFVVLILVCGKIIEGDKKEYWFWTLCFALLFWFFCPVPKETIFWMVGSTGGMWTVTMTFLFICVFLRCYNDNSSLGIKVLLFLFAIVTADSIIPCVSICGAFVVYYAMHLKKFRGNAVPLVVGFVIGSLILLLAPGNFIRAAVVGDYLSFGNKIKAFASHPLHELARYKVLWLFVVSWLLMMWKRKEVAVAWMKNNAILLITLIWSVIAFSIVFRPSSRALFFTESVSLVLILKLCLDSRIAEIILESGKKMCKSKYMKWAYMRQHRCVLGVLMMLFVIDAGFAIHETRKMNCENSRLLRDISDAHGVTALDVVLSSHRMAYAPYFPDWSWKGVAYDLGLDSVRIYPYYCHDKHYQNSVFGNQVYVDNVGYINADYEGGSLNNMGVVFVRNLHSKTLSKHAKFTISYDRPERWYSSLKQKLFDKKQTKSLERVVTVERERPDTCILDCDYYFIWMKRDNLENLKSVEIEIE